MKALLIYNEKSGQIKLFDLSDILDTLSSACEIEYIKTDLEESIYEKLSNYNKTNFDYIIIYGGDGTIKETIYAMIKLDINKPILTLPGGTTNEIAKSHNIREMTPKRAIDIINNQKVETYDIGEVLIEDISDYFVYSFSIGAFTNIAHSTPQKLKNIFGYGAYILYGITHLFSSWKHYDCEIIADGKKYRGDYVFLSFTNSVSIGDTITFKDLNVKFDDGLFELFVVENPENFKDLFMMTRGIIKKDYSYETFKYMKASEINITSEKEIEVVLDGEYGGKSKNIKVKNLNKRIDFLVD